jgi:hypothetical protein
MSFFNAAVITIAVITFSVVAIPCNSQGAIAPETGDSWSCDASSGFWSHQGDLTMSKGEAFRLNSPAFVNGDFYIDGWTCQLDPLTQGCIVSLADSAQITVSINPSANSSRTYESEGVFVVNGTFFGPVSFIIDSPDRILFSPLGSSSTVINAVAYQLDEAMSPFFSFVTFGPSAQLSETTISCELGVSVDAGISQPANVAPGLAWTPSVSYMNGDFESCIKSQEKVYDQMLLGITSGDSSSSGQRDFHVPSIWVYCCIGLASLMAMESFMQ